MLLTKIRLLTLTLLTAVTSITFAQKIIEGEVRWKKDDSSLPGINVVEKGAETQEVTDAYGKFKIKCKSANPTLRFSFIGLKTVELIADKDYLIVYLETDEEQSKVKARMGMYPEYTSVGLNSGVRHTPIGINIRNSLPILFGVRVFAVTDLTYRTDFGKNQFVDVRVKKDMLIDFYHYGRSINLNLGYNKRKISNSDSLWDTEELTIVPELQLSNLIFLFGYGRQAFNNLATLKSNQGFVFGLVKYFKWNARILGIAKKWDTYWQTEFQFKKAFEKNDFECGIRLETLADYREIDLSVAYRIHY